MTAAEYEWTYNGLSFGEGSSTGAKWNVDRVEGLNPPDIKSEIVSKPGQDGSWVFAAFTTERHIIISGTYARTSESDEPFDDMMATWATAFAPQTSDQELHFNLPGFGPAYVKCKPLNRTFALDDLTTKGICEWHVELVAGDPTIYLEAGGGPTGEYEDEVLADTPAGFWPLSEASGATAADLSGNGNDGTYVTNDAGVITYAVDGPNGRLAVHLEQAGVTIPADAALRFDSPDAITIEAWVKISEADITTKETAVSFDANIGFLLALSKGLSGDSNSWEAVVTDYDLLVEVFSSEYTFQPPDFVPDSYPGFGWATTADGQRQQAPTDYVALLSGTDWHHYVAVHDAVTNQTAWYVDGEPVSATFDGGSFALEASDEDLRIGQTYAYDPDGGGYDFWQVGAICDVAVYGYALGADRILAHFVAGT